MHDEHISDEDAMEEAMRRSREEYQYARFSSSTTAGEFSSAGSSRLPSVKSPTGVESSLFRKSDIDRQITDLTAEVHASEARIAAETARLRELVRQKRELELQRGQKRREAQSVRGREKGVPRRTIDYMSRFGWSDTLRAKLKEVFGIKNFRLCQEAVCNANLDGRDIICVMPTGGGKSVTYQLPALMVPGCTVVVSPLIALMRDQILHLREAGVNAVMLTGSTPRDEVKRIWGQIHAMISGACNPQDDIKICYVTPEKLAKSKQLMLLLDKLYGAKKLARLVLDEAHCISEMGHDYRPDYQKLGTLRVVFPAVPILALSATCPPKVLHDLMKVMRLQYPLQKGIENGGTLFFSSPLYRPNLHYAVLPKPSAFADTIKTLREYIIAHHTNHSGIIYCLSKKDAEAVASELQAESGNQIRTGVYHSDISDDRKEYLHAQWHMGYVNVVCATIAFGLGIDKADVRFVIHHSLPVCPLLTSEWSGDLTVLQKSIEGFYQESGRAGRDGKDADCILFYRPQDASRLSVLTATQSTPAAGKLYSMLKFAQDMQGCRKVLFAKYLSASSQSSVDTWTTELEEVDVLEPCGHCDNCTRAPDSFTCLDVKLPAWQVLKAAEAVKTHGGSLTMGQLASLVRGLNHGRVSVSRRGPGQALGQDTVVIDMKALTGSKVELPSQDTQMLCIHLLVNGYLKEVFKRTEYTINAYLALGDKAHELLCLSRGEVVDRDSELRMACCFPKRSKQNLQSKQQVKKDPPKIIAGMKRKKPVRSTSLESKDDDGEASAEDVNTGYPSYIHQQEGKIRDTSINVDDTAESEVEGNDGSDEWSYSMRRDGPSTRTRLEPYVEILQRPPKRLTTAYVEADVISIDSD